MTYHAQSFPNVPREYASVQVSLRDQLQVYDTRDKDFIIRTWVTLNNKWVYSDNFEIPSDTRFSHERRLSKKNYDWEDFKEVMGEIEMKHVPGTPKPITNLSFSFKDDVIICKFDSSIRTSFTFSPDLI